jgi:hypothetical protein
MEFEMDIQIGSALDENTRQFHHLVLVKHGLRVLLINKETGLPDETRCYNIGFAQLRQMDYDYGVLRLQTAQGIFCFSFPNVPFEEIQQFVDAIQQELDGDGEIEWVEG